MNSFEDKALDSVEEINVGEPWFKILNLPNDVFAIHEPKHQHCVISFGVSSQLRDKL